jgi:glyoxylase-like metal-dependent hydrolase (beta-lactamase superfamily II)
MDALWGEMLPVPASQLHPVHDGATLEIHGLVFRAIETPGHATHHHAYLLGDTCFTGDIGGVRLAGPPYLMLPMPPPEFHLEAWQASLARLRGCAIRRVAPTHFGIYDDAAAHWDMLDAALADVEAWLLEHMPRNPTLEEMQTLIPQWYAARARAHGLQGGLGAAHETANPAWMSAAGLHRYWQKFRHHM